MKITKSQLKEIIEEAIFLETKRSRKKKLRPRPSPTYSPDQQEAAFERVVDYHDEDINDLTSDIETGEKNLFHDLEALSDKISEIEQRVRVNTIDIENLQPQSERGTVVGQAVSDTLSPRTRNIRK
jgi:hypothetical protein